MILSAKSVCAILIVLGGFAAAGYWFCREGTAKKPDITSVSRFDSIFSKDIKQATDMADIPALRDVGLEGDDLEVRIWRAHDLPTLEGVFLKQSSGNWSGRHFRFRTDWQGDIQTAEIEQLKAPEAGWPLFFGKLADKGLLRLPLSPENDCDTRYIDGIRYFVEISQNGTYRNYQYSEGADDCRESKQMTDIGETIGVEFDPGEEKCENHKWFPCMTAGRSEMRSADAL